MLSNKFLQLFFRVVSRHLFFSYDLGLSMTFRILCGFSEKKISDSCDLL